MLRPRLKGAFRSLTPAIAEALADGDEQRATEMGRGEPLFIFLKRDHGALLQVIGPHRKAVQYEIGNPHNASKMTRYRLAAGLYAPFRVVVEHEVLLPQLEPGRDDQREVLRPIMAASEISRTCSRMSIIR
jgi:hypothetical protein